MKARILNYVNNNIRQHNFEISSKGDNLIFKLNNKIPMSKNYLIVKNRLTGKRVIKELKNSKASISTAEINEIDARGAYDVYLKTNVFGRDFLKRTKFINQNIGKKLFDEENYWELISYPTIHQSLSFGFIKTIFQADLKSLEMEGDKVILSGTVRVPDDIEIDEIEIVGASNRNGRQSFPCEFERDGSNIEFKAELKNDLEEGDIDSLWDFFIKIKNNDIILDNKRLYNTSLSDFKTEMDYFPAIIENPKIILDEEENGLEESENENEDRLEESKNENGLEESENKTQLERIQEIEPWILYFTNKKYHFKIQIVSKEKANTILQNAKNRDLYEEYKSEAIDNNLIFFESFHGKYNNSPKYIYKKMLEMGYDKKYKIVWSYDGDPSDIEGNPIVVNSEMDDYYRYLATAKYRIVNTTFPIIDSRKGRVYLQTWHGTPLKRLGYDITIKNGGVSWNHFNRESKTWDYLVSANSYSTETFKRAFRYNKEVLEMGYPANDILYQKDDALKNSIKESLNIPQDKKLILYAPTFRDDKKDAKGNRYFELELDLDMLYEDLKDDYILIIKTHSVVSESLELDEKMSDFIIDLSDYDDIHELFLISDILITDYSSVFFDFAHTERPMLFFMPDMEEYINTRGVYHEVIEDLPGPKLTESHEILDAIKNIDKVQEEFKDKYDYFYNKYASVGNGDSAERIIKRVFEEVK